MVTRFLENINRQHLFDISQEVLLAVSGGRDSVALCHLAFSAGLRFSIAHCNFHLRPIDCDRDEQFVSQLAERYHVPFYCRSFQTKEDASMRGVSVEEAARDERYSFFREICEKHRIPYVATAHHRDDSIETFFINLLRGTGISGLHGIPQQNGNIVRPMLCFSRGEIDAYVRDNKLEYVEDYTNHQLEFQRNKIRHQVLPLLRQISPSFDSVMAQNMNRFSEVEQIYKSAIQDYRNRSLIKVQGQDDHWMIPLEDVRHFNPQRTILFELLRPFHFSQVLVDTILKDLSHTSARFYSSDYCLTVERDSLDIVPLQQEEQLEIRFTVEDILQRPFLIGDDLSLTCSCVQPSFDYKHLAPAQMAIDADKTGSGLVLRHWRTGDRFTPLGMRGTRLLSDYFKDNKFSSFQKRNCWLLCTESDEIIWIVGHRVDDRFKIDNLTRSILLFEVKGQ